MNALNFIKEIHKEYIGEIDNNIYDEYNRNYQYYYDIFVNPLIKKINFDNPMIYDNNFNYIGNPYISSIIYKPNESVIYAPILALIGVLFINNDKYVKVIVNSNTIDDDIVVNNGDIEINCDCDLKYVRCNKLIINGNVNIDKINASEIVRLNTKKLKKDIV